jgi:hypothetical protein
LERDNARLAQPLEGRVNGRHLCGASRSGPVPRKLSWCHSARSKAPPSSHALIVGRGDKPQKTALLQGNVSALRTGFPAIQGCARRSHRLQKLAAPLGYASRKRATLGVPLMEGALGRRRTWCLTAQRTETVFPALIVEMLGVKSQSSAAEPLDRAPEAG